MQLPNKNQNLTKRPLGGLAYAKPDKVGLRATVEKIAYKLVGYAVFLLLTFMALEYAKGRIDAGSVAVRDWAAYLFIGLLLFVLYSTRFFR